MWCLKASEQAPSEAHGACSSTTSIECSDRHAQAKLCMLQCQESCLSACCSLHNESTTKMANPCRLLIGGLFNKKEDMKEGDLHPFDDTLRRLLSKLQVYHTISRPTPTVSVQAPLPFNAAH